MRTIAKFYDNGVLEIKGNLIETPTPTIPLDGLISRLDANTLGLSNEDEVLEWADISGNNLGVIYVGGDIPLYSETDINGNPAVLFQRNELEYPSDFRLPSNSTVMFMINQWQSNGTSNIFGNQGVTTIGVGKFIFTFRGGLLEFSSTTKSTYIEPSPNGVNILGFSTSASGEVTIFTGDREITESGHSTDFYNGVPRLSYNLGSRTFRGSMGEVLIYNRVLSKAEREEVSDYLTSKWIEEKVQKPIVSFTTNGDLKVSQLIKGNKFSFGDNYIEVVDLIENGLEFNPATMEGIQAYFDASKIVANNGTRFNVLADMSGRGNSLTGVNGPTIKNNALNGLPTFEFNGNNLTFPSGFKMQPNASIYIVVKSNSAGGTLQAIIGTQGITAVTGPRFYGAYHGSYLFRTQGRQHSSGFTRQDEFVVYSVRHNLEGILKIQVNNNISELDGHITEYDDSDVSVGFTSYRGLVGEIGEIIIFDRTLGDYEHNLLMGELREKWNI